MSDHRIEDLLAEVARLQDLLKCSSEKECIHLRAENERLRAYANHERSLGAEGPMIELVSARQEIERLRQDSAELDRLTIQWNEARAERLAEIDAIPGPSPEQEIKHLAEQCATLLRENERLRALSQNNATSWDAIVRERDELRAENERLRNRVELASKEW